MPKLKRMSGKDVISILKKTTLKGEIGCVMPLHSELAIGTLRGILRQAKVDVGEFMRKL